MTQYLQDLLTVFTSLAVFTTFFLGGGEGEEEWVDVLIIVYCYIFLFLFDYIYELYFDLSKSS